MVKKKETPEVSKGDMTPMIDMVFQLLIFFILMFKIVVPEGDFSIKMPIGGGAGEGDPPTAILIRLEANKNGNLTRVRIGDQEFRGTPDGMRMLRDYVKKQLGGGGPIEASITEIELDCDYNLKFNNVILIISTCTGYVENGQIIKLAEKIKFRAPRKPASD
ncbi:MAG: biopolymer transporter ExbD [Planctomycetia bacterium]|nr:biopolymer transporter ExbD [Planctomycetia bacterium]